MITIETFCGITVDISDLRVKEYQRNLQGYLSLGQMLEKFAYLDSAYLRNFLQRRGHNNAVSIRMLEAHGDSKEGIGYFYADLVDGEVLPHNINYWLDEHDSKYDVLYVSCCNPGEIILDPRKSTIVYPIGNPKGDELAREELYGERANKWRIVEGKK